MARRYDWERLLLFWQTDPRVILAGHATSAVWLRLVVLMDYLRDGEDLRLDSPTRLATAVYQTEEELGLHLETLIRRELLRRETDGGMTLPVEVEAKFAARRRRREGEV